MKQLSSRLTRWLPLLIITALSGCSNVGEAPPEGGCLTDLECRGERICVEGRCEFAPNNTPAPEDMGGDLSAPFDMSSGPPDLGAPADMPAPPDQGSAEDMAPDLDAPMCPEDAQARCDGVCVDPFRDPAHCGRCGRACDDGERCDRGMCQQVCTAQSCGGLTWCDEVSGQCLPGCARDAQCGARERCDLPSRSCVCQAGTTPCATGCCTTPTCFNGTLTGQAIFPPGQPTSDTLNTLNGLPVTLEASYPQQGVVTDWRVTRAPTGSAALVLPSANNTATFSPDVVGAYTIEATGQDSNGLMTCAPMVLTINAS